MRIEDYPAQEPLSAFGASFIDTARRLCGDLVGQEFAYADDDPCQGLLVFPAERPNGKVLGFMHGGGWTNGYKETLAFMAPSLNAAGITFASFSYRLAPRTIFPQGWLDAARATAWLYENVARFGGDPSELFLGGHSAGGHYAALLAVRDDWQTSLGLPGDVVRGCLPISGVYDFTAGNGLSSRPRFLGEERAGNEVAASPLHNLARLPPMLLAHRTADFPHLIEQAHAFEAAYHAKGGDIGRLELDGCDHLASCYVAGEPGGPWLSRALPWIAAH